MDFFAPISKTPEMRSWFHELPSVPIFMTPWKPALEAMIFMQSSKRGHTQTMSIVPIISIILQIFIILSTWTRVPIAWVV